MVNVMKNGYPSVSIEDIARLAGETCVYRGASQGLKLVQSAAQLPSAPNIAKRLLKRIAQIKR